MTRVLTYTANPAVDLWAEVDAMVPGEKLRTRSDRRDPGGGGINVARVLHALGTPVSALYLAGGMTRPLLEALLAREGLAGTCVPVAGEVRICQVIRDRLTGAEYRFVPQGPTVETADCAAAVAAADAVDWDWLVASGSLPAGAPTDHYVQLAGTARRRGARFAVDCAGDALRAVVESGLADLVKVSRREFAQLVGRSLDDDADVEDAARHVVEGGWTPCLAVTLGADGAILAGAGGVTRVRTPAVTVASTVGAGDSFLAGLVHGLTAGRPSGEALAWAAAAGAAACMRPGTQLACRRDIEALLAGGPGPIPPP